MSLSNTIAHKVLSLFYVWQNSGLFVINKKESDLLGSDVQQTSLHPSKGVVHIKLGIQQQLWHRPLDKRKRCYYFIRGQYTNSTYIKCYNKVQKKVNKNQEHNSPDYDYFYLNLIQHLSSLMLTCADQPLPLALACTQQSHCLQWGKKIKIKKI